MKQQERYQREINRTLIKLGDADINDRYHAISQIYLKYLKRMNKKTDRTWGILPRRRNSNAVHDRMTALGPRRNSVVGSKRLPGRWPNVT